MSKLIVKVLITKLRSANNVETKQYRKAAKALLVLIPLLGITYLVILMGPTEGVGNYIFSVVRALLISTQVCFQIIFPAALFIEHICIQGFTVSLFYCFLNSEVKQTLRHRYERWQDGRHLRSENGAFERRKRYDHFFSLLSSINFEFYFFSYILIDIIFD